MRIVPNTPESPSDPLLGPSCEAMFLLVQGKDWPYLYVQGDFSEEVVYQLYERLKETWHLPRCGALTCIKQSDWKKGKSNLIASEVCTHNIRGIVFIANVLTSLLTTPRLAFGYMRDPMRSISSSTRGWE